MAVAVVLMGSTTLHAEPVLQLYIEGATYDSTSQTWVVTPKVGDTFTLWVIGNTTGGGGKDPISDVHLSAVYDSVLTPTVTLTPTTTGGFGGFTDPSTPGAPNLIQTVSGVAPTLSDGHKLGSHGEYGTGRTFQEFGLGDFTLSDSPLGDFQTSLPSPSSTNVAQINAYTVSVTGIPVGDTIHFDAYGTTDKGGRHEASVFAPFSHDAEATISSTPEPASMMLLVSAGLIGVVVGVSRRWRRRGE
jgi:hypothetical protein